MLVTDLLLKRSLGWVKFRYTIIIVSSNFLTFFHSDLDRKPQSCGSVCLSWWLDLPRAVVLQLFSGKKINQI